jgi:hypothetical protein
VREVGAGDSELEPVPLQVALDPVELDVREVVRLDRVLEARVDLLDLAENLLRLRLLGRDRARIRRRCTGREERRSQSDDEGSRLPLTGVDTRLRYLWTTSAPGGAGTSQVRHPSKRTG